MRHRTFIAPAVVVASLLVAAGCGDDSADSTSTSSSSSKTTTTHASHEAASSPISSEAADTRVKLVQLLAEHSELATVATLDGLAGAPGFDASLAALKANGTDLADVIGSVYGDDAKAKFDTLWQQHIDLLVDYTVATAKQDTAGQKAAVAKLDTYTTDFSAFVAEATGLPKQAAENAVNAHVQHHAGIINAAASGDYATAWEQQRVSYQHMIELGTTLAGAIAVQQKLDDGGVSKAATETRVKLDTLLGEHTALATAATTRALDGAKDAPAVIAALSANSKELADVIGSVYGKQARAAFEKQWQSHIGMLVAYTTAVATGDDAGAKKAKAQLDAYVDSFGGFLATATGADAAAVKGAVQAHVQQHEGVIGDHHAKQYDKASELGRAAYAHMYEVGDVLTAAIAKQHPELFS